MLMHFVFLFLFNSQFTYAEMSAPPQFVLLAFDGSKSLDMWEETRDFVKQSEMQNQNAKLTYFISCVYFLTQKQKRKYIEPVHGAGKSAIGFGTTEEDVSSRVDQVNFAYLEGNEIASHACGHFPGGSKWSYDQWTQEFNSFNQFVFNVFSENNILPSINFPTGYVFNQSMIVGFRAPLLEVASGTWSTLNENGFRYDTSRVAKTNYWPRKVSGIWNFPLAELRISGTGKRTLSMDYNFYVAQSNAQPDSANAQIYYQEMLDTYLQYFQSNYNGNRAPVHIGHHFSKWNGGAYWRAMKDFAARVCGLPEVRCVTYRELADYMDTLSLEQIQNYQAGRFQKNVEINLTEAPKALDLNLYASLDNTGKVSLALTGKDAGKIQINQMKAELNGEKINFQSSPLQFQVNKLIKKYVSNFKSQKAEKRLVVKIHKKNKEILRASFDLNKARLNYIDSQESRALIGDLPEAHLE